MFSIRGIRSGFNAFSITRIHYIKFHNLQKYFIGNDLKKKPPHPLPPPPTLLQEKIIPRKCIIDQLLNIICLLMPTLIIHKNNPNMLSLLSVYMSLSTVLTNCV